jgi:ABC-2 type transport system permease protein
VLLLDQVGYQARVFRRVPIAAFFSLVFPLMLLVLFELILSGQDFSVGGSADVSAAQFYTPGLAVFAAASATYTNLAVSVPIARDEGILKRVRGTPMPPWIYLAGHIGNAIVIAAMGVTAMLVLGVIAYGVEVRIEAVPALVLTFVVGTGAFASLGMAVAAVAPSGSGAPAVANGTLLPVAFISNVFVPLDDPPRWLDVLGWILPLKPFVEAFSVGFDPSASGPAPDWAALAVVVVWGVAGIAVALRFFRWEPRTGASSGRRARRRRGAPTG